MANDQLTATSAASNSSQSQTTAQGSSLQPTQASASGTKSDNVQPGTATSLLSNDQGGVPLHSTDLSTVSLGSTGPALSSTAAAALPIQRPHHVNPALLGFPALLVLVAVVLFWTTNRSVKSTTQYT